MYIYMCRVCKRISPDHTKRKEGWLQAVEVGYSQDAVVINTLCPHCINSPGGATCLYTCEPVDGANESAPELMEVSTGLRGQFQEDWMI